ncbi:MAG: NAD-dependent epimerase/dehydratase family protein [Bacteroidetes bacterium]|nr:NAD-dependent epimerase/dehydratase family protein [Bacteroidota bacterium]
MKKIFVTGAVGFIGYHLTKKLISEGYDVAGVDNINNYYDPNLKYRKLPILGIDKTQIENNKVYASNLDFDTYKG